MPRDPRDVERIAELEADKAALKERVRELEARLAKVEELLRASSRNSS